MVSFTFAACRPLLDRDPSSLQSSMQLFRRIVVVGDALHAMSPFKGQGANQALLDGPLVADWVQRAHVEAAVRGIWREAVARTAKVVQASRKAAIFWHSPACIPGSQRQEAINFAGVRENECTNLMDTLSQRKVSAHLAAELDASIYDVIDELKVGAEIGLEEPDVTCYLTILEVASRGDTAQLRNLSLTKAVEIRSARDDQGRTSLHLAARAGHFQTCRWLLTEAFVDPCTVDLEGRSALDEASDPCIRSLFQTVMQEYCI
jgi:Ankyrin repeats (3 copies)